MNSQLCFLSYTSEHKNLPEKEDSSGRPRKTSMLDARKTSMLDAQPLKGHVVSKKLRYR